MKLRFLAAGGAVLLVLAGAAVAGLQLLSSSPPEDRAARLVPSDAFAYVNVTLNPSNDQKSALGDLLEHWPDAPSPDEAKERIVGLFDQGLAKIGANFEQDVDPWLGDQIAAFTGAPAGGREAPPTAALFASEDDDAARAFMEKAIRRSGMSFRDRSQEGFDYLTGRESGAVGIVGDFLVLGNEAGFKSVARTAAGGSSLQDLDRFSSAGAELSDDRLASMYLDLAKAQLPAFGMGGIADAGPVAGVLFASSEGLTLESTAEASESGPPALTGSGSGLLPDLPSGSWGALGFGNLGETLGALVDAFGSGLPLGGGDGIEDEFERQSGLNLREDVLTWMGDAGIFVQGSGLPDVGAGLVIETTDRATSTATVKRLATLARRQGLPVRRADVPGAEAFVLRDRQMGIPIVVAAGERVVVALGEESARAALATGSTLGETEGFERAAEHLGDDFEPMGYFDLQALKRFAEGAGARQAPDYAKVEPWLRPLSYVTFGTRVDGERVTQRLVIGVE